MNKFNYKEALIRLQEIQSELESGDKGVDDLSELVKEAAALVKQCKEKLKTTEEEIQKAFRED